MRLTVAADGLVALGDFLGGIPKRVNAAAARAVNRTVSGTVTQARRRITAQTGIKAKRLNRRLSAKKAKGSNLAGLVWVGTLPFKASWIEPIAPRQPSPKKQRKMDGATAGAGKYSFPGAFVARMPNGSLGIMKRKGKARLPLKQQTLDADELGISGMESPLAAYAADRLDREMAHELGRVLGGAA